MARALDAAFAVGLWFFVWLLSRPFKPKYPWGPLRRDENSRGPK